MFINFAFMGTTRKKDLLNWAELLFISEGLTQKEIAARVGVTEKTIGKWKEEGKWEERKAATVITKPEQLKRIYQQINELTDVIKNREEGKRFPSSAEADILNKLSAAAKNLENDAGIADTINAFMPFLEWLRPIDLKKAQEINNLMDGYIKSKI
jgi:transcriptional regulator with XRE-family HTH domain